MRRGDDCVERISVFGAQCPLGASGIGDDLLGAGRASDDRGDGRLRREPGDR